MKTILLEHLILAHRHLYYSGEAVISDYEYDKLESAARNLLPESSEVHSCGEVRQNIEVLKIAGMIKGGKFIAGLIPCVKEL